MELTKTFFGKREKVTKKVLLVIIIVLLVVFGLRYVSYLKEIKVAELEQKGLALKVGEKTLYLEVVATPAKHYLGLSNRPSLCKDCGMLFIFSSLQDREFVMRNMEFPLDIVFLRNNQIVKVYENLAPEGNEPTNYYDSSQAVNNVIELNAGMANEFGLKVGTTIDLPF